MGGNPRALRPHVIRPSPLAQVCLQRPPSLIPETSELVRDSVFWKRFSVAVQTNISDVETGRGSSNGESGSPSQVKYDAGEWLSQQYREQQHYRRMAMCITVILIIIVTGAAVSWWYFTSGRHKLAKRSLE